jgi:hypothetical protein
MGYSMDAMTDDAMWPYGERSHHRFMDNFHTGYNLVALKSWMDDTGDASWLNSMERAYRRFLKRFWLEDGCPKYYHDNVYPIDIHCSAQGILTCLALADSHPESLPMARKIATWAIENMQDESGHFYYQKTKHFTNKIPYMRWSQAWMFYALARLLSHPLPISAQSTFG